jgi:hypothetical protein
MLNFVYLRSSRLHFLHFLLDSCIVNNGKKERVRKVAYLAYPLQSIVQLSVESLCIFIAFSALTSEIQWDWF